MHVACTLTHRCLSVCRSLQDVNRCNKSRQRRRYAILAMRGLASLQGMQRFSDLHACINRLPSSILHSVLSCSPRQALTEPARLTASRSLHSCGAPHPTCSPCLLTLPVTCHPACSPCLADVMRHDHDVMLQYGYLTDMQAGYTYRYIPYIPILG
jgi:hypothetical protein